VKRERQRPRNYSGSCSENRRRDGVRPNQPLHVTGHAIGGFARYNGFSRVSRHVNCVVRRLGGHRVIGDWMGSQYDVGGRRYDYRLLLDHDGRYERTVCREPDYERKDTGGWFHDKADGVLRLESDTPDDTDRMSSSWWVLSVRTCEDSNCILVLRWVALASRNLPVLLYRVHCDGRGYGTGWEQKLAEQNAAADGGRDTGSS
jgi:hypothetical protein